MAFKVLDMAIALAGALGCLLSVLFFMWLVPLRPNLGEALGTFPFMLKMMMKPNSVYVQDQGRKVGDRGKVAAAWKQILAWRCSTLLGYHEPPGEGFVGDGQGALRAAVAKSGQLRD